MNLHQFRFVQEAVRRNLNLTETAKALFTSQPGISWTLHDALGETPHVIAALADAAIELAGLGFGPAHHPLDGLAT